jgi:glycosyltransferase involved in cell wall biosynthesis
MTQGEKISVIIPNYNYAQYVGLAIESVLGQSYQNVELIVVNNGSTDNSLDILRNFGKDIILINQFNLGQSGARNSGLLNATGDIIAFLDADDVWQPTKLEKQIQLLNESTQLIYCGIAPFKEGNPNSIPIVLPTYSGDCTRFFIEDPGASIVLSGESTALFSRKLLDKVGTFDTALNSTAGWDFFRRCSRVTNFDFVNEPLVNYRLHATNMSNSKKNVILDMRRAYSKLFEDEDWAVSKKKEIEICKSLELSYLKTYLKIFDFKSATSSAIKLLQLHSKFA